MLVKCRVHILNNRVVCENDKKLMEKNDEKKNLLNDDYGYIKNKNKLKHLLDIGVDLSKYHPSILRAVCDSAKDYKLNDDVKPQLQQIAKESHEKGFIPSTFGSGSKLHKQIKTITGHIPKKYKPRIINPNKTPTKTQEKKTVEGGSITDLDEILSEIESDLEAGEITDAESKLKAIKHKIPKKVYTKIKSTIRT